MIPENLHATLARRVAEAVSPREAAVDVMKELQAYYGWLTDGAVAEAAVLLGLSTLQVEELATFYEMIYRRPVGRIVVHVCDSISCWCAGCNALMDHLCGSLGVEPGGTSADGAVTLIPCCCLGMCGDSPAMSVDGVLHGNLTPETADRIIARAREELATAS